METENNRRWLRTREAARLLDVSESTVRSWLGLAKLEGFKAGTVVRVDRHSIEELARTHRYAEARRRRGGRFDHGRWTKLARPWPTSGR